MTDKQKAQFELVNNSVWLLLKGYVKDDKPYKTVMSEMYKLYLAKDDCKDLISDEWWDDVINGTFMKYPEKYKGTELENFVVDLAIGFCDVWEQEKKGNTEYWDFYKCISKAFLHEWERLRGEKETKTQTAG